MCICIVWMVGVYIYGMYILHYCIMDCISMCLHQSLGAPPHGLWRVLLEGPLRCGAPLGSQGVCLGLCRGVAVFPKLVALRKRPDGVAEQGLAGMAWSKSEP